MWYDVGMLGAGCVMGHPNRILIVDDEAVIRELLCDILSDDGYSVDSMPGGPAALELLRAQDDFALLFTDIMMPEMDGIQLIREARKVRPSLIPIVMTGFATVETARAAVKEGAYDYVLKPFSLSEVKMAVSNALERYRLAAENTRLRDLTDIFEISEAMASIRQEKQLLEFVLNAALKQVGAERGSLMIASCDGKNLEIAASVGLPREAVNGLVEIGKGISGKVASSRQPILVENLGDHPELLLESRNLGDPSFVSLPLVSKFPRYTDLGEEKQILAVLNVCNKQDQGRFSDADLKTLSIVANHAAAAIDNVRTLRDLERAHLTTVEEMVRMIEARDEFTKGHGSKVRDISLMLAQNMGMSEQDLDILRVAGPLHDIGKLGVSGSVLAKNGRLNEDEWASVRQHTVIGHDLIKPIQFLNTAHLQVVRSHHERVDGSGYPDGLSGEAVPPLARVVAAADAYVAMSSPRPYREALSKNEIVGEFRKNGGSQFDGQVADLAVRLIENGEIQ
ncbi:MAG: response regulator [Candidatus Hydrogenedentes bacterium]|nr:response regulator [Candidatus Hydrogenedentota bacterium]